jgi:hypothetical protein
MDHRPKGDSMDRTEQIVGWMEQQAGAAEYLQWICQGTPAEEALAAYQFDTGTTMEEDAR